MFNLDTGWNEKVMACRQKAGTANLVIYICSKEVKKQVVFLEALINIIQNSLV